MKKMSFVDIAGSVVLAVVVITIFSLFFFAGNGEWIARISIR
jgi:hypothetical protein